MKTLHYKKQDVIVVVPLYRPVKTVFEKVSLDMLFRHLGDYTICFVVPESFDEKLVKLDEKRYQTEHFPDCYFENVNTYSELCLSESFYQRFIQFKYMLIYQLDALVFSDRLLDFCNLDYDYIGAPLDNYIWSEYHVGNGGLSLRKISSTLALVREKEYIFSKLPSYKRELFEKQEDNFFAYCGATVGISYRVPDPYSATEFSAQSDAFRGITDISSRGLPFGTHHWPAWNYHFWRPIVQKYGYELPELSDVAYKDTLENDYQNWIMMTIYRYSEKADATEKEKISTQLGLNTEHSYIIRGGGSAAEIYVKFLIALQVPITRIWCKAPEKCRIHGFPVTGNTPSPNKSEVILIASWKYEEEIREELRLQGLVEDEDFISLPKIMKQRLPYMAAQFENIRVY